MARKPSFIQRLTGAVSIREYEDEMEDDFDEDVRTDDAQDGAWQEPAQIQEEGELPIDMYQTGEKIVIRALIAGVSPDDLDIAITRDMVTIKGGREENREAPDEDYYHRELYWGGFSRTILLPEEILIDEAEAKEKHGMLEIILPKVDKDRSTRLKVKTKAG
jgi:HSP20 family molecular chaperone IbpA